MIEPIESLPFGDAGTLPANVNIVKLLMWLLRKKRMILGSGVIFALVGLGAAFYMKPQFVATAEILPPQQTQMSSATALMAQAGASSAIGALGGLGSALQAKTAADMYAAMLEARPIQDGLIQRFGLQTVYRKRTITAARTTLASHTTIMALKEGFITIAVRDTDPKRAAMLANAYIEGLRTLMRGLSLTTASQRRMFYEQQLVKTKEDLAQAEVSFKQMQQSSHMISVDAQAKTLIEGAAELRAQVAAKEVELQGLRAYSTEANPQVEIAEKELGALRAQEAQVDEHSAGSYSDAGLSSVPGAELNFVRASRELKYQEQLYELLVKQYEGARIDEAEDAPVVQVVEPAIPPERKSAPNRSLIVLAAFAIGVIAGVAVALYQLWKAELSDTRKAELAALRKAALRWNS